MLSRQGLPISVASALLLTAITTLAVWFTSYQEDRRAGIERDALEQARTVLSLSDAEAYANLRALEVLARSQSIIDGDLPRFERYAARVVDENPDWNALVVRDAATGRILLQRAKAGARPNSAPMVAWPEVGIRGSAKVIREARYCPCVVFQTPVPGRTNTVLAVFVSPDVFQRILVANVNGSEVSALASPDGRFVSRTLHYRQRIGLPGSPALQRATRRGGEGLYRGTTLEGAETYTAFATSKRLGWSAHVAVDASRIDNPRGWQTFFIAAAILAALLLATGLILFAAYEGRRRVREEKRLVEFQRAEAMSRFTGMLTHDFRNILASIDAGTRLILKYTKEEQTETRARAIGEVVERGVRLVNQLLSFARGGPVEVHTLDLRKCIEATDELLRGSLGSGIEFTWHIDEDARHVRGNPDQLEFALLNLAVNARDAMHGHGAFTLKGGREGQFTALSACDTGPGVPPHLRERIFEAFYSTKDESKGTGLGLAQVAGAARQAGGRVELRDNPAGGACFVMYLPLAEPTPDPA